MTKTDSMMWHWRLIRQGRFILARSILRSLTGSGRLYIADRDDAAYGSGLVDFIHNNFVPGSRLINRRRGFSVSINMED